MKTVQIQRINDFDKLAKPIVDINGSVILKEGTELKREYIKLLKELDIDEVTVIDPATNPPENRADLIISKLKNEYEYHIFQNRKNLTSVKRLAEMAIEDYEQGLTRVDLIDSADIYTFMYMVGGMSYVIGKEVGLDSEQTFDLVLASFLMEIGTRYLSYPFGRTLNLVNLTAKELMEYHRHPIYSFTVVEKEDWISTNAKRMILFHHEHIDGSGYPLRKRNNPLIYQIIPVCNGYLNLRTGIEGNKMNKSDIIKLFRRTGTEWYHEELIKKIYTIIELN